MAGIPPVRPRAMAAARSAPMPGMSRSPMPSRPSAPAPASTSVPDWMLGMPLPPCCALGLSPMARAL
eukprot:363938-Chlamydomonas_euryale.AAC.14